MTASVRAARAMILAAVIGLGGSVVSGAVGGIATLVKHDAPESCSALIGRVDDLSPEVKRLYAKPGALKGLPRLASTDEVDRCGGDPESLLEQAP